VTNTFHLLVAPRRAAPRRSASAHLGYVPHSPALRKSRSAAGPSSRTIVASNASSGRSACSPPSGASTTCSSVAAVISTAADVTSRGFTSSILPSNVYVRVQARVAAGRTPSVHCTAHKAHTVDVICFVNPPGRARAPGQEVKPKYTIAANWLPKTPSSYSSCAARDPRQPVQTPHSRQPWDAPERTRSHASLAVSISNFRSNVHSGRQNMLADISM
jgi:hypothetical protein